MPISFKSFFSASVRSVFKLFLSILICLIPLTRLFSSGLCPPFKMVICSNIASTGIVEILFKDKSREVSARVPLLAMLIRLRAKDSGNLLIRFSLRSTFLIFLILANTSSEISVRSLLRAENWVKPVKFFIEAGKAFKLLLAISTLSK